MITSLDRVAAQYLTAPPGMAAVDFANPLGAPALIPAQSVLWRVMKNPVALIVGGLVAVILELAEPRVRTGIWKHTSFKREPALRMCRTFYAAMVTIYAPADVARTMIAGIVRAHARIHGSTPKGIAYRANDQALLDWVHATASFGFIEAYSRFVRRLSPDERDQAFAEGAPVAALYGAHGAPRTADEMDALFQRMRPNLERSEIIFEFLDIVRNAPILPSRALQRLMLRAAINITPAWARDILGLDNSFGLNPAGSALLRILGAAAERMPMLAAPPAQACKRMGLSAEYLYR